MGPRLLFEINKGANDFFQTKFFPNPRLGTTFELATKVRFQFLKIYFR